MPAPKFRGDYDQLRDISTQYRQAATTVKQVSKSLHHQMEVLQKGDWVGQGANAFYAEMADKVLPGIQRLEQALDAASNTTRQINELIKQTEDDTARILGRMNPQQGAGTTRLGSLSEKYEVSKGGPGTVSTGQGDAGGASYGLYQMTSKGGGTVGKFIQSPDAARWASDFQGLQPGSAAFTAKWKQVAAREPQAFGDAQHAYIQRTHYDPLVAKVQKNTGLDVSTRSTALQDVVWSTAVQHGPATDVIDTALKGQDAAKMSDEQVIRAIYAERGRRGADGQLVHFRKNSKAVQEGVAKRFTNELQDALKRLPPASH